MFVFVRVVGWTTRVKAKEIMRGLFLIGLQETSIRVNMCEMCSFVFQEKSGSLPGQSYTSSKNASRSDHSPVFGEYRYVKVFVYMTSVRASCRIYCVRRGRLARWWVSREEGGFLKVAGRAFLTKQRQAARSVKGYV